MIALHSVNAYAFFKMTVIHLLNVCPRKCVQIPYFLSASLPFPFLLLPNKAINENTAPSICCIRKSTDQKRDLYPLFNCY